jgi:MATE family multidrug resistance protein
VYGTAGAPALKIAKPYLRIRSLSFLPMLTSFVGFSAFRGTLDVKTSVMIAYSCNMLTVLLDPLLIHGLGFGVKGAALATFSAEIVSAITYLVLMRKRDLIRWSKILKLPSFTSLIPLLKGGMALQLRSFALNITFLMVARVIQSMDDTGVAAAANAMATQTFQLGGIVLGALSMVAQTVVPNAMVERYDDEQGKMVGGVNYARTTVNRLMIWGLCIGVGVGALQLLLLPTIMKSSPLQEVRDAARVPALIASWFQGINGLVFVGEGVMMGTGSFMQLGLNTAVGTLGYLASLKIFPQRFGLTGVWIGLVAFTLIRLIGVFIHLFVNGPLTQHNVHKASTTA